MTAVNLADHAVLAGRTVLLALEDDFVSHYLASVLSLAGAELVGYTSENDFVTLHAAGGFVSACVADSRHATAVCSVITRSGEPQPALLLLDAKLPEIAARLCERLVSPYAGHQVVEAIAHMLTEPIFDVPVKTSSDVVSRIADGD